MAHKMKGHHHGNAKSTIQHHQPSFHRHQRGRQTGRSPNAYNRQRKIRGCRPQNNQRSKKERSDRPRP